MGCCDLCDVLIVGAGPAGASAALSARREGAQVLVVDRRRVVGVPVQCAEYIPAMLREQVGLGTDVVVQRVVGMRTHIAGRPAKDTAAPGYMIRRDRFDQALIAAAVDAGAELRCATRAVALGPGSEVLLSPTGQAPYRVRAKVIIGADGPRSTVGKWIGAVNRRLLPGVQLTLALTGPSDRTEVYFEPGIVGGYAWLFPKGPVANVGLAMCKPPIHTGALHRELNRLVARLAGEGRVEGKILGRTAGWIPVEPLPRGVHGNVLLAGDAAGQTHPITGAGVFHAVTCGAMAGKWAARAAAAGDPGLLQQYELEWRDLLGRTLTHGCRKRREMEAGWHDLERTVRSCWVAFREYHV